MAERLYPYGLKQTTWRNGKGDVVGDFVASCRRVGIKPGIYYSVHRDVYQQAWAHYVDWGQGRRKLAQQKFKRIGEKQMEELCSRCGPLIRIWLDAGAKTPAEGGPDLLPIFRRCQPQSVFYHSRGTPRTASVAHQAVGTHLPGSIPGRIGSGYKGEEQRAKAQRAKSKGRGGRGQAVRARCQSPAEGLRQTGGKLKFGPI